MISLAKTLLVSSTHFLPASQPPSLYSLVELSKIPLQSYHPWAQILQPSHCLQNRVQALHRVTEASQGLMPSYHLNFIPNSLFHETAASVSRSIQSLLGLISVFLWTPNTYSCPLLCRHPSQLSRPISNTTSYVKPFRSPQASTSPNLCQLVLFPGRNLGV